MGDPKALEEAADSFLKAEALAEKHGWEIECHSPFEMRHEDGSFASGQAAQIVMLVLQYGIAMKDEEAAEKPLSIGDVVDVADDCPNREAAGLCGKVTGLAANGLFARVTFEFEDGDPDETHDIEIKYLIREG